MCSESDKPEIEPRLPDNILDRLEELHRRYEDRGLTDLEWMILVNDLRQFSEAVDPLIQTMTDAIGEIMDDFTETMTDAMAEVYPESVGECRECGIDIYQGEWHTKISEGENAERMCLSCDEGIDPDELADDQMEDYQAHEARQ